MIVSRLKKILLMMWWVYGLILVSWLMTLSVISAMNKVNFLFMWLLLPVFLYFTRVFRDKKTLDIIFLIYGVIFCFGLLIIDILAIKSWSHGLLVIMLLPLPIYLGKILKTKIKESKNNKKIVEEKISEKEEAEIDGKIIDYSKRNFLKFLAGSGVASLVMFLLSKKTASAAFFGSNLGPNSLSLTNSKGQKVDPATNSPLDGYVIANIEENVANNYFGFTNRDGEWYIMRVNNVNNSFSYYKGASNYTAGWEDRIIDSNFKSFAETF